MVYNNEYYSSNMRKNTVSDNRMDLNWMPLHTASFPASTCGSKSVTSLYPNEAVFYNKHHLLRPYRSLTNLFQKWNIQKWINLAGTYRQVLQLVCLMISVEPFCQPLLWMFHHATIKLVEWTLLGFMTLLFELSLHCVFVRTHTFCKCSALQRRTVQTVQSLCSGTVL